MDIQMYDTSQHSWSQRIPTKSYLGEKDNIKHHI